MQAQIQGIISTISLLDILDIVIVAMVLYKLYFMIKTPGPWRCLKDSLCY